LVWVKTRYRVFTLKITIRKNVKSIWKRGVRSLKKMIAYDIRAHNFEKIGISAIILAMIAKKLMCEEYEKLYGRFMASPPQFQNHYYAESTASDPPTGIGFLNRIKKIGVVNK
jgi:hypothetical protein